ncbi:MAG: hypothetical protein WDW38_011028 [Sanguina aurantia]
MHRRGRVTPQAQDREKAGYSARQPPGVRNTTAASVESRAQGEIARLTGIQPAPRPAASRTSAPAYSATAATSDARSQAQAPAPGGGGSNPGTPVSSAYGGGRAALASPSPSSPSRFTARKPQTTPGRLTLPGTESQEIGTSPHDASAGRHARAAVRPLGGSVGTTPRDHAGASEGALPGNKTPNSHPHLVKAGAVAVAVCVQDSAALKDQEPRPQRMISRIAGSPGTASRIPRPV